MRLIKILVVTVAGVSSACAAPPVMTPPTPSPAPRNVPAPAVPSTEPGAPTPNVHGGSWAFTYRQGTYTYDLVTEARIAQQPDTMAVRAVPPALQRVTIALSDSGVAILAPQASPIDGCTMDAALASRAHQLIPALPPQLVAGAQWTDSMTTEGCRGAIPTTTTLIQVYTVLGDTTYNSIPALHIARTETISAKGEGHEGQHRILLSATGSGLADLYVDVEAGRFLGSTGTQTTHIDITTSGRTSQFIQHVTEQVALSQSP